MEKLLLIFTLFSLVLLLSNCESNKPEDLPLTVNGSTSMSFTLISAVGVQQSPVASINLKDFSGISEYVKYVKTGSVLATSFIEVKGLTAGQNVKLTNVSLEMASDRKKSLKLNDIESNTKIMADTSDKLLFLQSIMDEILRRGSSSVVLKYTPTTNMVNENNKFTIRFNTQFKFE